jgi:hypothetical protein
MVLLCVSAFLPYMSKGLGIRVENLLGAGLALLACVIMLMRGRLTEGVVPPLVLSIALFLHVVAATLLGPFDASLLKAGLGRFDHYFRPVSVLLVAAVAFHDTTRVEREQALRRSIVALLTCVSLNTLVQIASVFTDVTGIIDPFMPDASQGWTVASTAAANLRFTGIFNQPLEHGLVYSVALLTCVYAWRTGGVPRRLLLAGTAATFIGGVLALSKVFLLGGLPVSLLLVVAQGGIRRRQLLGAALGIAVTAAAARVVFSRWGGFQSVLHLVEMLGDPGTVLYAVSGGRVGSSRMGEEYIVEHALAAYRASPLFGVGTASGATLQDNEYLMTLAECGLIGVGMLLLRLMSMAAPLRKLQRPTPAALLLVAIVLLALGGGMGGPVSGIPRSGTILWVFYAQAALIVGAPTTPEERAQ